MHAPENADSLKIPDEPLGDDKLVTPALLLPALFVATFNFGLGMIED